MLFRALSRTLHSLSQPYFLRLLGLCAGVTFLTFIVLLLVVGFALRATTVLGVGWQEAALDVAGFFGSLMASWFLLPLVIPLIGIVFQENVANQVDRHEYREVPATSLPFWSEVRYGLKFSLVALGLNLLCLPLYFTVILFPFVYYLLNGYLLGREFFETAAARYVGRPAAVELRKRYATTVTLGGILIVLMTTIPFVNLAAPFTGIALMVHLYRMTEKPS